jgi:hypothetical protein
MSELSITLSKEDYREILIESFNSENTSISDYLFSKYIIYKASNLNFVDNIYQQLNEMLELISIEIKKNCKEYNIDDLNEVNLIVSPNNISVEIKKSIEFSSLSKNYIVNLNKINSGYLEFIDLVEKSKGRNNFSNKLNWVGSKVQLIYLLHRLKKDGLITNTYESLAQFLIDNTEKFAEGKKQTIMDDLKNGIYPKTGINIEEVIIDVKTVK